MCFEGMEESGSEGLDELVIAEAQPGKWFDGVDCACISDNYWLNTRTPAITYGLRGLTYFTVTVTGPGRDLHSGVFGRTVHEPMTDLVLLLSKLVDVKGNILVPGVDELVPPPTEEEKCVKSSTLASCIDWFSRKLYAALDYSIDDVEHGAGGAVALSSDKIDVLMGRMRYPSLSVHGIEGAHYGPGAKVRTIDTLLAFVS